MNNRKTAVIPLVLSTIFFIVPISNATSLYGQGNIAQAPRTIAQCDASGDNEVTILDVIAIINNVLGTSVASAGMDCNDDGKVDILDIVASINFVLQPPVTTIKNYQKAFTYDSTNRIVKEAFGNGKYIEYIYDDNGNLIQQNVVK